jgi:hypothetical protein
MALKGRHWFLIWLIAACAALWLVIWRQTDSFRTARALNQVREQRAVLAGQRASLEARIRAAQSREQLIPRAARLGLRAARDSEIFRITAPAQPPASPPPSSRP